MSSLIGPETRIVVSSVLNKDITKYGKKHLTDDNEETCWNSEQGLPQYILLDFASQVLAKKIELTFQGGFAGKVCVIYGSRVDSPNDYSVDVGRFYPEDINSCQAFSLEEVVLLKRVKIVFEESSDFYGRITVYRLDVIGSKVQAE